jgi:diguanylate cyclase (GGDEF)-like protein
MLRVLSCLSFEHDHRLVALAALVCLMTTGLTVRLLPRLQRLGGWSRAAWLTIVASIAGMGVWATHFIAMVAFKPHLPTSYALVGTGLSLLASIALIGGAVECFLRARSRLGAVSAGGLFGLAVGVMHYAGMAAFEIQGYVMWDKPLVAASIAVGAAFGAGAFGVAYKAKGTKAGVQATLLMTLAICGLHFTGMGAALIVPDPAVPLSNHGVPTDLMGVLVGAGALLLLAGSLIALLAETRQRRREKRRLAALADAAVEGLVICRDSQVVIANKSFMALIGAQGELAGRVFGSFFEQPLNIADISSAGLRTELTSASGEKLPVELTTQPILYEGMVHIGVSVRDLRDRVAAEAQLRFLAHHDPLTRLPNRLSFSERLESELKVKRRKDDQFAVICLDLDRFKQVNDVFGHGAGDAVLKVASERIGSVISSSDVLARLGGDEFAILRTERCSTEELSQLCDDIQAAMASEMLIEGHATVIGASIGIALYPADGETATSLMRNADAALYQAKNDGRGVARRFSEAMGAQIRERERLEFDLRQALVRNELRLVYQPQNNVFTGEIVGYEALVRWDSPGRGEVTPGVFIPLAEESGLILPIGEWILREACRTAARWDKPLRIAVNLSAVQLKSPKLASLVHEVLIETGLSPARLELEITETALVQDFHAALNTLRKIKALGVKVAMDDFGTGYSSLSNLRAFPFDKIKIDRSFIQDVDRNEQSATIVRAVIGLARGLNVSVLAEGVEKAGELEFLKDQLCAEAQGFYWGKPGQIEEAPPAKATPARQKARRSAA